jgi:uncharacterized cupin superfamily protein
MERVQTARVGRSLSSTLWASVLLLLAAAPEAAAQSKVGAAVGVSTQPLRLDRGPLGGLGLKRNEPMSPSEVLEGSAEHRNHVFFRGPELVVEIWEAGPAKLAIAEPFPYDEFIKVLSGKLILTDSKGARSEYDTGEFLVVPKGFTGTWEMLGNYRELVVIERKAWDAAESPE